MAILLAVIVWTLRVLQPFPISVFLDLWGSYVWSISTVFMVWVYPDGCFLALLFFLCKWWPSLSLVESLMDVTWRLAREVSGCEVSPLIISL